MILCLIKVHLRTFNVSVNKIPNPFWATTFVTLGNNMRSILTRMSDLYVPCQKSLSHFSSNGNHNFLYTKHSLKRGYYTKINLPWGYLRYLLFVVYRLLYTNREQNTTHQGKSKSCISNELFSFIENYGQEVVHMKL